MPQKLVQHSLGFSRESRMDSIMRSSKAIMFNTRTKNKHESNLLDFERKKIVENKNLVLIHTNRDINNERECLSKMLALKKVYQRHSFDKYDPVLHPQKRNRLCHMDARDLMKMWFKGKSAKTEKAESDNHSLSGSRPASSIFHRMRMASGRSRSRQMSSVSGEGGAWGTLLTETIHEEAGDDKEAVVYRLDDDKIHLVPNKAENTEISNTNGKDSTKDTNSTIQLETDDHDGQTSQINDQFDIKPKGTDTSRQDTGNTTENNKQANSRSDKGTANTNDDCISDGVSDEHHKEPTHQTIEPSNNQTEKSDKPSNTTEHSLKENTTTITSFTSRKSNVKNVDHKQVNDERLEPEKNSKASKLTVTTKLSENTITQELSEKNNTRKLSPHINNVSKSTDTSKSVKILERRKQLSAKTNKSQNSPKTQKNTDTKDDSVKDLRAPSREKSISVMSKASSHIKEYRGISSRETTSETHSRKESLSSKKVNRDGLKESSVMTTTTPSTLKKAHTDLDSIALIDRTPFETRRSSSASTLKVDRTLVHNAATNNPTNWKGLIHKLRGQHAEAIIDDRVVEAKSTRRLKRREKTFVLSRARTIFPGECKSTFEMRRFFEREVSDLIFSLSPKGRRQSQIELLKERERLPTLINQSKSTSAILKDFRRYRTEARTVTAP